MAINVKLPEALVETAKRYGTIEHRSVPKQIEYWSQIGKIAAENPDLPFSVIRDILIADQEEPVGEYQFGWCASLSHRPSSAPLKSCTSSKKPRLTSQFEPLSASRKPAKPKSAIWLA